MLIAYVRMAIHSIRSARMRSLLTISGIVIGVASVVLAFNVGQGVRKQVSGQIEASGGNLISVRSGRVVERSDDGEVVRYSLNQAFSTATLTAVDLDSIGQQQAVEAAVPLAEIPIAPQTIGGQVLFDGHVIATTNNAPDLLGKDVIFGSRLQSNDRRTTAVIGVEVAEELFGDPSPLGRAIRIKETDYIIKGVLDRFQTTPLSLGVNYNRAVFIPYDSLDLIGSEDALIREILVDANDTEAAIDQISIVLAQNRPDGSEDYSVIKRSDLEFITGDIFNLLTTLVAAVAGISLVVGGIGVMNIMLVNVAERTREIGIRKAIGASKRQIMAQFMMESVVLSSLGGVIGVTVALIAGFIIRSTTSLRPIVDVRLMLMAIAVSMIVGIVFGVGPAFKAARKRPVESLRS